MFWGSPHNILPGAVPAASQTRRRNMLGAPGITGGTGTTDAHSPRGTHPSTPRPQHRLPVEAQHPAVTDLRPSAAGSSVTSRRSRRLVRRLVSRG